jgi:hypothetical protein
MAPVREASTLQFVPNLNAMTMPVTSRAPYMIASPAARPIVNDGKMMGKLMTKPN